MTEVSFKRKKKKCASFSLNFMWIKIRLEYMAELLSLV